MILTPDLDGIPVYLDQEFIPHTLVDLYVMYRHQMFIKKLLKTMLLLELMVGQKNFPEFYAEEFAGVIKELGFNPTYYRSSDVYRVSWYNEAIKMEF